MAAAQPKVMTRLKLLIDTEGKRVLYAEAGKDFADFLFQILSLPLGTVVSLLRKQDSLGSLANLYESVENLNNSYMQSVNNKNALLKFMPLSVPLLALNDASSTRTKIYGCSSCGYIHRDTANNCPICYRTTTVYRAFRGGGIVKDMVTYMVMDDLVVTPLSTMSSIALLQKHNITEFSDQLEEKIVDFGMDEAVKLLNASLRTKKVLTDVFLNCTSSVKREADDEIVIE